MARFEGAIFDVDGVLVDSPHEKAWRESLRELMEGPWRDIRSRTTWSPDGFTPQVYQTEMSGKPRLDGARAALAYFHVPDDEEESRVAQYADDKQVMVVRMIEAGDFTSYPDALRFVLDAKDDGIRIAAASSSKNANLFLGKIRLDRFAEEQGIASKSVRPGLTLLDAFDADVSGREFAHGKPHPDMFLAAAHELGVAPEQAVVLEDHPRYERDMNDLTPVDTGHRVQVDTQLVGVGEVVGADRMRVEVDAAEVDRPHQACRVVQHRLLGGRARGILQLRDVDVVGPLLGRSLLKDRLFGDALDEPLEDHRPVGHPPQRARSDIEVIANQVHLGDADVREDDLVGMRDRHLLTVDLQVLAL